MSASTFSSWMGAAKASAQATIAGGELTMVERNLMDRKKAFGVELYDLLLEKNKSDIVQLPSIFKDKEHEEAVYQLMKNHQLQVATLAKQLEQKEAEIQALKGSEKEAAARATTMSDRLNLATRWASDSSTIVSKRYEMQQLKKNIRANKEQFGWEVWPFVAPTTVSNSIFQNPTKQLRGLARATNVAGASFTNHAVGAGVTQTLRRASLRYLGTDVTKEIAPAVKNVSTGVSDYFSDLSRNERRIQVCIETAQQEIGYLQDKKERLLELQRQQPPRF